MPVDALAIDAQHIGRRFGRRWALADVTFQLRQGAVLMLAGHNGSGKTTLLRVLATLLRPDLGRATVAGFDVAKQREPLREHIALLSHYSYLYEALTARENLSLCRVKPATVEGRAEARPHIPHGPQVSRDSSSGRNVASGFSPRLDEVDAMLERVGLIDRANDPVSTFSAGMRKRLSFARILLKQPKIIFLDEPYGQLDPQGFALVDEVIAELKAGGATIVVATHQVEHVVHYADERLTLAAGRVAA
jgi:heme exporter protein A